MTYTLLSAILLLNLRIILSDPFLDVSSFCIACVYNECHQKNQIRRSKMGLTSHLSNTYDAFSSCFLFFLPLESDDNDSDDSDDNDSGSGFTSGSCTFSLFSESSVGGVSSSESVGNVSSS